MKTRLSCEHSDAERKLFGTDTAEGAESFDRGVSLRELHGWSGAMDRDGRIPDPDSAGNDWFMSAMKPAEKQAVRDMRASLPAEFRGE